MLGKCWELCKAIPPANPTFCSLQAIQRALKAVADSSITLQTAEDCEQLGIGEKSIEKLQEIVSTGEYRRNQIMAQDPHHRVISLVRRPTCAHIESIELHIYPDEKLLLKAVHLRQYSWSCSSWRCGAPVRRLLSAGIAMAVAHWRMSKAALTSAYSRWG